MRGIKANSAMAESPNAAGFSSYQKRVLTVLTLINLVNWIDRQIIYPLFPLLKDEFHVSYTQLGWLVAVFSLVHAVGSFGLGCLADRTSRKRVISYGVLFWSVATFASGLAGSVCEEIDPTSLDTLTIRAAGARRSSDSIALVTRITPNTLTS